MSSNIKTDFKTPQRALRTNNSNLSTPILVPPSPMLQQMGYGTGVHIYRIERSPEVGTSASPWVVKRLRARISENQREKQMISSRLLVEANILKSLNHPNIVGYRASKTLPDDRLVLAMERCDTSLGDLIELRVDNSLGPIEALKIKKMSHDVCKALDYLHNQAFLLHGDLKSYNVLVNGDFELCKLCDFGVSMPLNEDGYLDLEKNPSAKFTGTDLWSAPEVFSGHAEDISTKSDIFSFGLIIYECVALQAPHVAHLNGINESSEMCLNTSMEDDIENIPPVKKLIFNVSNISESNDAIGNNISLNTNGSSSKNTSMNQTETETELDTEDESMLAKSTAATIGDDTSDPVESYLGTRPPIPDVYDLPNDYNQILEIFFICTNELPENRPTAAYLAKHLENIIEKN